MTTCFLFGNMVKNLFYPTIKFRADWTKEKVCFLDVEVTFKNGVPLTDLFVNPTDTHQFIDPTSCHPYHYKKTYLTVKHWDLIGFVPIIVILISDVTSWKLVIWKRLQWKMVRKHVLRAREHSRESLLEKVKSDLNLI